MSGPSSKNSCPISSTPFLSRNQLQRGFLGNLYEDLTLSPITQFNNVRKGDVCNPQQHRSIAASKRSIQIAKPATSNRRKTSELTKESASGAVLKELGIKPKSIRTNLSNSRNMFMYNTHSQLVVLDSDEEECVKSVIEVKPTSTKNLKIRSKNTIDDDQKNKKSVKHSENENNNIKADIPKTVKKSEREVDVAEHSKPTHTRILRGTKRKQPLGNLENLPQPSKNVKSGNIISKTIIKQTPKDIGTIVLDNSDSFFNSSLSTINKQKKKITNTPLFEDIMNDNTIQWTPRAKSKMKTRQSIDEDVEKEENDEINFPVKNKLNKKETIKQLIKTNNIHQVSDNKVDYNKNKPSSNKNLKEMQSSIVPIESCKSSKINNPAKSRMQGPRKTMSVKETVQSKGNCSYEEEAEENDIVTDTVMISRFGGILFKSNKHNGGIVAKSLETCSQTVGYLEVEKDKIFSGSSSNVTFVMIEGQRLNVFSQGATHTLYPGDMIHFKTDAAYKFENVGCEFTRLLFIKYKIL